MLLAKVVDLLVVFSCKIIYADSGFFFLFPTPILLGLLMRKTERNNPEHLEALGVGDELPDRNLLVTLQLDDG